MLYEVITDVDLRDEPWDPRLVFHWLRGFLPPSGRRIAQHVAAPPHRFDVVFAVAHRRELLAQLADEHVDDLEFSYNFV